MWDLYLYHNTNEYYRATCFTPSKSKGLLVLVFDEPDDFCFGSVCNIYYGQCLFISLILEDEIKHESDPMNGRVDVGIKDGKIFVKLNQKETELAMKKMEEHWI